jgi:hypothetical protein
MSITSINVATGEVTIINEDAPAFQPTNGDVTAHAEKLIEAGVTISITGLAEPVYVQGRDKDSRNVQGLVTAAQLRLAAGDTATVTKFRDGNNVMHDLTPAQVIELWQKSAAYVSFVYAASWAIKDGGTIAQDFADDERWPNPDQTV